MHNAAAGTGWQGCWLTVTHQAGCFHVQMMELLKHHRSGIGRFVRHPIKKLCMQVIPTSLEQALMVAKGAAQAHAEDDEEAEGETEREMDARREQDGAREHEREQNEEEAPAKEQEDERYAR